MQLTSRTADHQTGNAVLEDDETGLAPRVFLDLSNSVIMADESPTDGRRAEVEVARRLIAHPALRVVPVVFDESATMFALGDDQVDAILAIRPGAAVPCLRTAPPPVPVAIEASPPNPPESPEPLARRPAVLRVTGSAMRAVARNGVSILPASIREDARAILVHGRQIMRTALYRRALVPGMAVQAHAPAIAAAEGQAPEPAVPNVAPCDPDAKPALLSSLKVVVHPREGDVLWTSVVLDAATPIRRVAELDRYRRMGIVAVFYDATLLQHPEFAAPGRAPAVFEAAALDVLRCASLVVAVSDWSRAALLRFAGETGLAPPPIAVIRPGASVAGAHHGHNDLPGPLADLIGSRRFALAVGPVETRRNFGLLVRIWEALAAKTAFDLDLVIVGPPAPDAGDAARAVEQSPLLGSRITWITSCPDNLLSVLYAASEAVLCPSFIDGCGASVTEALAHGRPVVASAGGAHPEAAMGLATLLDPHDDRAWTDAVLAIAAGPHRCVDPPATPCWDDCAEGVAQSLMAIMSQSRGH